MSIEFPLQWLDAPQRWGKTSARPCPLSNKTISCLFFTHNSTKGKARAWGCNSVAEHVTQIHAMLGLMTSWKNNNNNPKTLPETALLEAMGSVSKNKDKDIPWFSTGSPPNIVCMRMSLTHMWRTENQNRWHSLRAIHLFLETWSLTVMELTKYRLGCCQHLPNTEIAQIHHHTWLSLPLLLLLLLLLWVLWANLRSSLFTAGL